MKSLAVEIWEKIIDRTVWAPTKAKAQEFEGWADGDERILLPDLHPLSSAFGGLPADKGGEAERALTALRGTSKQLRAVASRYYEQILSVPLACDFVCKCSDEPTTNRDACTTCGNVPREHWSFRVAPEKVKSLVRSLRLTESENSALLAFDETDIHDSIRGVNRLWELAEHPPTMPTQTLSDLSAYTSLTAVALGGQSGFWMDQAVRALTARNKDLLRQVSIVVEQWSPFDELDATLSAIVECCPKLEMLIIRDDVVDEHPMGVHHSFADTLFECLTRCSSTLRALKLSHLEVNETRAKIPAEFTKQSFTLAITRLHLDHVHAGKRTTRQLIERCSNTLEFLSMWDTDMDHENYKSHPEVDFSALRQVTIGVSWWADSKTCEVDHPGPGMLPLRWACPVLRYINVNSLQLQDEWDADWFVRRANEYAAAGLQRIDAEGTHTGGPFQEEEADEFWAQSGQDQEAFGEEVRARVMNWPAALEKELKAKGIKASIQLDFFL